MVPVPWGYDSDGVAASASDAHATHLVTNFLKAGIRSVLLDGSGGISQYGNKKKKTSPLPDRDEEIQGADWLPGLDSN